MSCSHPHFLASYLTPYFNLHSEWREPQTLLSSPPNPQLGDIALPLFKLMQITKKKPPQILSEVISNSPQNFPFTPSLAGPYLNITVQNNFLYRELWKAIQSKVFFSPRLAPEWFPLHQQDPVLVEYSQPNTHKELHVGHMRNVALGKSVVCLLRYFSKKVITATYPGDYGTHVAKCLWYLCKEKLSPPEHLTSSEKGEWLGNQYALATKAYSENPDEAGVTEILTAIEQGDGEIFELWKTTRAWSLELMHKAYRFAGVDFDRWYYESDLDASSISLMHQLHRQGKLQLSQGAIGMDLSSEDLGFCMLVKSSGKGLYATKDIALSIQKFNDYPDLKNSVYLVDARQSFHFKQVFKVLQNIDFKNAANHYHLAYEHVELPTGAMSSRTGNIIPLFELIHEMENTISSEYLKKYQNIWSEEAIQDCAADIARGAIFYGMLKMDPSKKIVFDMGEWLKLDGESGPYLQYVSARIHALLEKFDFKPESFNPQFENTAFNELEHQLLVKLTFFNQWAYKACTQWKPSVLAQELFDVAKLFNRFYAECPVGKAPDTSIRNLRLGLSFMVQKVLQQGLKLLGIPTPNQM